MTRKYGLSVFLKKECTQRFEVYLRPQASSLQANKTQESKIISCKTFNDGNPSEDTAGGYEGDIL